jgi:hypothetical protein
MLLTACAAFGQEHGNLANQQAAEAKKDANPLLGVWEVIINGQAIMSYEFTADGKRKQVVSGVNISEATYKIEGDKVTIIDGTRTEVCTFEVKGDKLTLKAVDSRKMEELTRKPKPGEPVG